ncbi:hypothetical protein SHIRM173S_09815 [Streptomyces hirsutus]
MSSSSPSKAIVTTMPGPTVPSAASASPTLAFSRSWVSCRTRSSCLPCSSLAAWYPPFSAGRPPRARRRSTRDLRAGVDQQLTGEAGVAQGTGLRGPLVAGDAGRVVPGAGQPVHVPHPGEHGAGPLQFAHRPVQVTGLLQCLAQVVQRPRLPARVLVVPGRAAARRRSSRAGEASPGSAGHGPAGSAPRLAAGVAGPAVQLERGAQPRSARGTSPIRRFSCPSWKCAAWPCTDSPARCSTSDSVSRSRASDGRAR